MKIRTAATLFLVVLFTCIAPGAPELLAQESEPTRILFTNVNVFDGAGAALARGQDVLVEANLIAAVGPNLQAPEGAVVIDGADRTLMPGLIDAHTHLFVAVAPLQVPLLTAEDGAIASVARAEDFLMKGFTSVRDLTGNTFPVQRAIDRGLVDGPRIYSSGAGISQTSGHLDVRLPNDGSRYFGGEPVGALERFGHVILADGVAEVQKAVRENLYRGAAQIKVMAGGGVVSLADPLDATQYTADELRAAVAEAERYGTYVAVHAHTDEAINSALDAGVRSIEHGALIREDTVQRLVEMGVLFSPQAFIGLQDPAANPAMQDPIQIAKARRTNVGVLDGLQWARQHGATVLWGTDIFGDRANFNTMIRGEWEYRGRVFSPLEQLQQATGNNGRVLALSGLKNPYPRGPLGVIQPGAYADILLIDGDPTQDITIMMSPEENFRIIMKDGKIYKNTLR